MCVISVLLVYLVFTKDVCSSAPCLKRSALLTQPLVQLSTCYTQYYDRDYHQSSEEQTTSRGVSTAGPSGGRAGYPGVYAGEHVYVSADGFRDRRRCVTADMLPDGVNVTQLTGAGFSSEFLHLAFGTQLVRVHTRQLLRWLDGERWRRIVEHVSLPADAPAVTRLAAVACCSRGQWCAHAARHLTAYSLPAGGNGSDSDSALVLHVSDDQGATYRTTSVSLPAGGAPLRLVQYQTERYSSLFFNHAGGAWVSRLRHGCRRADAGGCQATRARVADEPLRRVVLEPGARVLTVLVTRDGRLRISARADAFFETATIVDAATLQTADQAAAAPRRPLKAFAVDGPRWVIVDADNWAFVGGALNVWDVLVYRFRLGGAGSGGNRRQQLFVLHGRTLDVITVTERGPGAPLAVRSRRVSLTPHLAALDARCQLSRLHVRLLSSAEPVVDKNSSLTLEVHVRAAAAAAFAARPLVLLSSPMLVSRTRLLSAAHDADGTVSARWAVAVTSHPDNRRRPYMARVQLARLHVATTVGGVECPPRQPRSVAVLVGCDSSLRLVALNRRVDAAACRRLRNRELLIGASAERDPLLRHQQRLRGDHAVRLEGDTWRVRWDPTWGCPLLSGDKAQFRPVLAVQADVGDGRRRRPLRLATVMFEIHGLHDFEFTVTLADANCRRPNAAGVVSWRRANDRFRAAFANASGAYDPALVLNTSNYVSCNDTSSRVDCSDTSGFASCDSTDGPPARLGGDPAPAAYSSFELFGLPGLDNAILWGDSQEIHVFNFRVVDPLFTFCDLSLTVPVFYMHASDVSQDTKLSILLVGIGLSLLLVVAAHVAHQVTMRVRCNRMLQRERLLVAADAFVAAPDVSTPSVPGPKTEITGPNPD